MFLFEKKKKYSHICCFGIHIFAAVFSKAKFRCYPMHEKRQQERIEKKRERRKTLDRKQNEQQCCGYCATKYFFILTLVAFMDTMCLVRIVWHELLHCLKPFLYFTMFVLLLLWQCVHCNTKLGEMLVVERRKKRALHERYISPIYELYIAVAHINH